MNPTAQRRPYSGASFALACLTLLCAAGAFAQPGSLLIDEHGRMTVDRAAFDQPNGDAWIQRFEMPADRLDLAGLVRSLPARGVSFETIISGRLPEGDTPAGVVFTTDGTKIVVAHRDTMNLIIYDANTRAFLREIPLSGSPNDLALSADGQYAVTANVFEDTASIVDLSTGSEVAVVPVGDQPGVVRITPDSSTAVIGNTVSGSVSVVDIATATEVRQIGGVGFVGSVSMNFESAAITASFSAYECIDNSTVLNADYYNNRLQFIDISAGTVTNVASTERPRYIAVTPAGTKAVCVHDTTTLISVIDPATQTISKTINVGAQVYGPIAINPTGTKAVVGVQNACRVVNLLTDAVSANLNTASVNQLLTTADGNYCLCVGYYGSLISYAAESIVASLNYVVSTSLGGVSPTGPRAAMAATTFGEQMLVVNTNGAAGHIEEVIPSGPAPEGDKCRTVAVTPDGSTAVAVNIFSDNASIIDLATKMVVALVDVGDRPSEVAITPDGGTAVVANLDSYFVSIIDIAGQTVANVAIGRRGSQVEISPDGQYAYVAVVADGDGVYRINLDTLAVEGPKLLTGDMGTIYYIYNQSSGMTLSHDGNTLVVCGSFNDTLTIIDTGSWSVVRSLNVVDFPVRAIFSADDSTIYVSNRDNDLVTIVDNAGPGSTITGTVNVGDRPYEMALAPDQQTLYVINHGASNIGVVDVGGQVMTTTIPTVYPASGLALDAAGENLHAATGTFSVTIGPGPAFSISLSGGYSVIDTATNTVVDDIATQLPPGMLVLNEATRRAVAPSPFVDGLILFAIGYEPGDMNCDGLVNFDDIDPFVLALSGQAAYEAAYPDCDWMNADCNADGSVDFDDIDAFVALLAGR